MTLSSSEVPNDISEYLIPNPTCLIGFCRVWSAHQIHTSPRFVWIHQESERVPHDQLGLPRLRTVSHSLRVFHFRMPIWPNKNFLTGYKTLWAPATQMTRVVVFRLLGVFHSLERAPQPSQDRPPKPEARRRKARSNGDFAASKRGRLFSLHGGTSGWTCKVTGLVVLLHFSVFSVMWILLLFSTCTIACLWTWHY